MVGTAAYMSPEQVRAKELDARTDLCSFGAALCEMATGSLPFCGESAAVIFEAVTNRSPVAVVRLNHDVPPKLEDVINKALEKDRNLRYQHAADMRTDLQRVERDTERGHGFAASAGDVAMPEASAPRGANLPLLRKRWSWGARLPLSPRHPHSCPSPVSVVNRLHPQSSLYPAAAS
jgi:serine/threonine protein kinase